MVLDTGEQFQGAWRNRLHPNEGLAIPVPQICKGNRETALTGHEILVSVLRDFTRAPQVDTVSSPGVGVVAVSLQLPPRLDAPVRKG